VNGRPMRLARFGHPTMAVPAPVVVRVIREWMAENRVSRVSELSMMVFGTKQNQFVERLMRGLTQRVSFDHADFVFCKLGISWSDDPELWEAYQAIDLRMLDFAAPTTERRKAIASRYLRIVWKTEAGRSAKQTAALTGVSAKRVLTLVPSARQRANRNR